MAQDADPGVCTHPLCDVAGILITLLQLGQIIPQHYEMWVDQSTIGVSAFLLLFGSLYTYLAALDVILGGQSDFTCEESIYRCFMKMLPLIQMAGSALLTSGLWYWYLKFHKKPSEEIGVMNTSRLEAISFIYDGGRNHDPHAFFNAFLFISGAFTAIGMYLVFTNGTQDIHTIRFAQFCGIISGLLNSVMWLPQIYTTYMFKHKGALSKEWVLFSVIMDVVFSVYLALMGMDFTVWFNNIPDGIQTSILLTLIIMYEKQDFEMGIGPEVIFDDGADDEDEFLSEQPLLFPHELQRVSSIRSSALDVRFSSGKITPFKSNTPRKGNGNVNENGERDGEREGI